MYTLTNKFSVELNKIHAQFQFYTTPEINRQTSMFIHMQTFFVKATNPHKLCENGVRSYKKINLTMRHILL